MSNLFGSPRVPDDLRTLPQGVKVGSYQSYLDAQKAVDYLADQQFPVQFVSIVGNDLHSVERVTGRLSYPRVALSGLLSGVWFGLFIGLLLSFFSPGGPFSIITSVLMGAAFFMLFGVVSYATQRGRRDFTSTSMVIAANYDVIVSPEVAQDASRLLSQLPMRPSDAGTPFGGHGASQQGPAQPGQGQYGQGPYGQPGQYGQQAPQQPQQRPQGQGADGQQATPERPQTWGNPYGQQNPAQEQAAQPEPADTREKSASADYADLADGRPQYGIRLPQNQAPQDQTQQSQTEQSQNPETEKPKDS